MRKYASLFVSAVFVTCSLAAPADAGTWKVQHDWKLNLNARTTYDAKWAYNIYSNAEAPPAAPDPHADSKTNVAPAGPFTVNSVSGTATADTTTQATDVANADGSHSGTHYVKGNTHLGNKGVLAVSEGKSSLALITGTVDARGRVTWAPNWTIDTIGFLNDPMDFSVTDLDTNLLINEELFATSLNLDSAGTSSYSGGNLSISGSDGSFELSVGGAHVTDINGDTTFAHMTSTLAFTFSGGLITSASADGMFAGMAPVVGASSSGLNLSLPASGFDLGFDFDPGHISTNGYMFDVNLSGDGMIIETPLPSAAWAGALTLASATLVRLARRRTAFQTV